MKRLESSAYFLPFLQMLEGNSNRSHFFSHNSEKHSIRIISPDKPVVHQAIGSTSLVMTADLIFQSRCSGLSFQSGYSPQTRKTTAELGTGPGRVYPQQKEENPPTCGCKEEKRHHPPPPKSSEGLGVEEIEYGCKRSQGE